MRVCPYGHTLCLIFIRNMVKGDNYLDHPLMGIKKCHFLFRNYHGYEWKVAC